MRRVTLRFGHGLLLVGLLMLLVPSSINLNVPAAHACGPYVRATDNTYQSYLQGSLLFDSNCGGQGVASQTHRTDAFDYPNAYATIDYCTSFPPNSACAAWMSASTPEQWQDEQTAYYTTACAGINSTGTQDSEAHGRVESAGRTTGFSAYTNYYQRC